MTFRQSVKNAWAQIDVQLKRRHDLIPNLVNTVKGYAAHEKETFERVINARARATSATSPAEVIKAEGEAIISLDPIIILRFWGMRRQDLAEARRIVEENQTVLLRSWRNIHGDQRP